MGNVTGSKPSGKSAALVLTPNERAGLEKLIRGNSRSAADRARVVLRLADGATSGQVAEALGLHPAAVRRIKARFLAGRLGGLGTRAHTGRPPEKRQVVQEWAAGNVTRGRLEGKDGGVLSARDIARLVSASAGVSVSVASVRAALKKGAIVTAESGTR